MMGRWIRSAAPGLIGILVLALLAGCGGGGGGSSSASGGPGPGGGGGPGGGSGTTFASTAVVTNRGVPQAGIVVTLSRGTDSTGNPVGVIARVTTNAEGRAGFTGLSSGTLHCYSASIASENRLFCSNRDETTIPLTFGQ
jgi:hypothetical protein